MAPTRNRPRKSSRRAQRGAAEASSACWTNKSKWSSAATPLMGLLGGLLCYLAQPPANLRLLAWIGPTPWLLLVRLPRLPGRRPYRALWVAGTLHWLATLQWLRLAHPMNYFAWLFIASYLGLYLPSFVALSRVATRRLGAPLWVAGPVVWTGLEWLRARLLTGFLMASLAHTQFPFASVIQVADLLGEYGVTFFIVLVSASIASSLPTAWLLKQSSSAAAVDWRPRQLLSLTPGVVGLVLVVGYGAWRLHEAGESPAGETLRVAIIQSDMLSDWKGSPARDENVMRQQLDLSVQAARESDRPIDLLVWPETMFRHRLNTLEAGYTPPDGLFSPTTEDFLAATPDFLASMARDLNAAVLVGIDRTHWRRPPPEQPPSSDGSPPFRFDSFNSAVLVDRQGRLVGTYDKMHLLPFGEYVPFASYLPLLGSLAPITGVAKPGDLPQPLAFNEHAVSVNICYESVLPHLIRRQLRHLVDATGAAPQLLVNVTNDAWYWGSSELDMHLACGVFRAVESRIPLVISANRGLSAQIDASGRLQQATQRDRPELLLADVQLASHGAGYPTPFVAWGDWLALLCLVCCMVLTVVGLRGQPTATASAEP